MSSLRKRAQKQGATGGGRRPARFAVSSRSPSRPRPPYEKGRLRIDFDAYEVFVDGRKVALFLRELEILYLLTQPARRAWARDEILDVIWGAQPRINPRTVDVHVHRLRSRIERDAAHPELIVTVRGVGYRFDDRSLT